MIDREKQIEEMATIINTTDCSSESFDYLINSLSEKKSFKGIDTQKFIDRKKATALYNAGYRKMDEITLKLDLGDRSAEEIEQIAEAFNKAVENEQTLVTVSNNEEEIAKRVAKEIYKRVDEFRKSPELNPRDSYDCNALDAYNNVCKFINRKYGVEIEK